MDALSGKTAAAGNATAVAMPENAEPVYISMLGRFEIRAGSGVVSDATNRSMKM